MNEKELQDIDILQNWLDGKYVSPPEFKQSLVNLIAEIRQLRKPLIVSSTINDLAKEKRELEEIIVRITDEKGKIWNEKNLYKDLYTKANTQNDVEKLAKEVKRLNRELESWQDIARDGVKYWCMYQDKSSKLETKNKRLNESQRDLRIYKDLYTKVNTQNMVYKVALEEYADKDNWFDVVHSNGCKVPAYRFGNGYQYAKKALDVEND